MTKITPKPKKKKRPNTPKTYKMTKIPPKPKKMTKIHPKPKKKYQNTP